MASMLSIWPRRRAMGKWWLSSSNRVPMWMLLLRCVPPRSRINTQSLTQAHCVCMNSQTHTHKVCWVCTFPKSHWLSSRRGDEWLHVSREVKYWFSPVADIPVFHHIGLVGLVVYVKCLTVKCSTALNSSIRRKAIKFTMIGFSAMMLTSPH